MGIRSFLAFELPVEIREQIRIISEELKKIALPVRWVKPNNIHLTILFLGSVDEDIIGDIEEKVNVAVRGFSAFRIRLNAVGAFPHWRRPRVIWIGLNGDIAGLSDLRNELQEELKLLGFKPEKRPFRAHLTLGRFKGPIDRDENMKWIIDRYHDITGDLFQLNELILYKSVLRPDGPVYTKMSTWPLRAAD
ncbi:MAG: RNA 2',3'-cyclic phosphodiesterase [Deltaproteobacteria bacterium]|nr:RNA 2',3'-cyclic phosphodiesterase [Deltaproteobacteria bacterium]HDH86801.1 RNA 2',3'-cyclic phosphodiesterase [Desulfobacteraceae bacterium]MBW2105368.1 RNA 2',3'-cyclic phosphodiesterase [Deltaproteobacteria bacterium]MBW2332096.1 RNA 2',3'-cyclic phosphodiesterase [Deltaproteobacteria bacterium]RLB17278.1 MAG: RNA 2',3'-cyclic phosphodiesterase [Deltaproteobacteria bacterium]